MVPASSGPFGAAAAVGRLLGFDAATMARAFGLAGSQAAGTFAAWGTPTVKFHQCRGALSGLMAALLAQQGFVANPDFLTCPDGGLFSAYSDGGYPERVTADLGTRWELEEIALRPWPAAAAIQGMISALFDLLDRNDLRADDVAGCVSAGPARVRHAWRLRDLQPGNSRRCCRRTMPRRRCCTTATCRCTSSNRTVTRRLTSSGSRRKKSAVALDTTLSGPEATVDVTLSNGIDATRRIALIPGVRRKIR